MGTRDVNLPHQKAIKSNSSLRSSIIKNLIKLTNKSNMIRTVIIIACLLPATSLMAFSTHPNRIITRKSTTALTFHPDVFEKAVDCAQNYGMCNVDELLNLAEQLEEYKGCYYEEGAEACQKEIDDRHDLADLLLLQTEMQQRDHYLKEGNLFAYDVKADKDMHDRDNFFDKISPALDV